MTKAILDSSAVLAYINEETGAGDVVPYLGDSLIASVNLAEVLTKLITRGASREIACRAFDGLFISVADFTRDLAEDAAALVVLTHKRGLSLGDRACLALARREKLPVLTADRAWEGFDAGTEIRLIR